MRENAAPSLGCVLVVYRVTIDLPKPRRNWWTSPDMDSVTGLQRYKNVHIVPYPLLDLWCKKRSEKTEHHAYELVCIGPDIKTDWTKIKITWMVWTPAG